MLLGVTLLKKKYPLAKYLCVLLIVAGVALFMYKPKKVVGIEEHTVGFGELLLVRSPVVTQPFQQIPPRTAPTRQAESLTQVPGSAMATTRSLKYLAIAKEALLERSALTTVPSYQCELRDTQEQRRKEWNVLPWVSRQQKPDLNEWDQSFMLGPVQGLHIVVD